MASPVTTLRLDAFERVVFFTGAGMSAESGVPTYRGKGGIWREYDYERYACQEAFEAAPEAVWEFHNFRRTLVAACEPNAGHRQIADVQTQRAATVITQNIDGLHQLAGSTEVIELHGSLWRCRCDGCGAQHTGRETPMAPLRCDCGAYWRPDIVWFGDSLRRDNTRRDNIEAANEAMLACDLFVSIGTSAVVYPAADLPLVAKRSGATLIEINPDPTPVSELYDVCLRGTATEMLAALDGR